MYKLFWQVFKYGIIGVLATLINLVVAGICAATIWPCLGDSDLAVRFLGLEPAVISNAVRATRAIYCNLVGFFAANFICWLLNRRYVFTAGRHVWFVEYALFLAGSGFAILCGSAAIWCLVRFQGLQTTYSFLINVVVSVAVNFVVRKFLVFKG